MHFLNCLAPRHVCIFEAFAEGRKGVLLTQQINSINVNESGAQSLLGSTSVYLTVQGEDFKIY